MSWIGCPIRIRIMRRDDLQLAAGLCDAMQLIHETENVGHVLDNMTTNYFFEFIVSERIRKNSEIVNNIRMARTIRIDPDSAGKFVLTTTDIKDLFLRRCRCSTLDHELVFIQQQRGQLLQIHSVNWLAQRT